MKQNFEECLALVLKEEGGYSNNPHDSGGATNFGVTQKVYEMWVNHPVSIADIKALTVAQVAPIYRQEYWNKIRGDDLPSGVDYALMDYAVNSGVSRAAKELQNILKVTADGSIGPKTLLSVNSVNPVDIIKKICDNRIAFLQGLSNWTIFGRGWGARVARVANLATRMASNEVV